VLRAVPHNAVTLYLLLWSQAYQPAPRAPRTLLIWGGLWRAQRSRTPKARSIQHGLHHYSTSSSRYISTSICYAVNMLHASGLLRRRKRSPKPVTCCNQQSRTCGILFANSTE
jgi:hypothetical protein